MEEPIAYKNEHGIWIYNRLPPEMRVALKDDFFDDNGEIILEKKFLAKSYHFSRFEAHTTNSNFEKKWGYWLDDGCLFILR